MGASPAYFALYPADFIAATQELSVEELGIYWRLLLSYYATQRPLPVDWNKLRRICSIGVDQTSQLEAVLNRYFVREGDVLNGIWRHTRADHEINRSNTVYRAKVEGAEKARKAAAAAREKKVDQ